MTFKERKTVVGYDGSRSAQAALEWAATDARRRGSELLILHVAEWGLTDRPANGGLPRIGPMEKASMAVLNEGLARVRRLAPEMPVTLESSLSGISRSLIEASRSAEMVVLGVPESRTVEGKGFGNTTAAVVTRAHCPVVVVSPGVQAEPAPDLPITVGYDGTPGAERALLFAARRAQQEEVPLHVIVVFPPETRGQDAETLGQVAVARVHRCYPGVRVRYELTEGTAVPVLADASRGCGLIVVGNRGHGLITGLMAGSVGNGLITRTHSPLAVVH